MVTTACSEIGLTGEALAESSNGPPVACAAGGAGACGFGAGAAAAACCAACWAACCAGVVAWALPPGGGGIGARVGLPTGCWAGVSSRGAGCAAAVGWAGAAAVGCAGAAATGAGAAGAGAAACAAAAASGVGRPGRRSPTGAAGCCSTAVVGGRAAAAAAAAGAPAWATGCSGAPTAMLSTGAVAAGGVWVTCDSETGNSACNPSHSPASAATPIEPRTNQTRGSGPRRGSGLRAACSGRTSPRRPPRSKPGVVEIRRTFCGASSDRSSWSSYGSYAGGGRLTASTPMVASATAFLR